MIKSILHITMAVCAAIVTSTASALTPEQEEKLHPVIYPFTINVKTANKDFNDLGRHTPLTEDYGYVLIPSSAYRQKEDRSGSLGIIVAHPLDDQYYACELRCARCLYESGKQAKMQPIKSISPGKQLAFLECPSCGAQMGSFVFNGSASLDVYENKGRSIICQEPYYVNSIWNEYGEIIELRIENPAYILDGMDRDHKSEKQYRIEPTPEMWFPNRQKSEFE